MKIIVDIEDFWMGEEDNLSEKLEKHVSNMVVAEIWKKIEDQVSRQITLKVAEVVHSKMSSKINERVEGIVKSGLVKKGHGSEEITMEQYVTEAFEKGVGYNNIRDHVTKLAQRLSSDLKDKTDLLFASQIVVKLNDQGLLKEDVAKALLNGK